MLQQIRDGSKGWISWLIVGLIAITFVVIGTGSIGGSSSSDTVAKVGSHKITRLDLEHAYEQMLNNPNNAHLLELDSTLVKNQVLDALIQNQILVNKSYNLGLRISDRQIGQILASIPAFQEDGRFSPERYLALIQNNRFNDGAFRKSLKEDTLIRQIQNGIIKTAFSLPEDINTVVKFIDQKRDFGYLTVESKKFNQEIKPSVEAIKAYYAKHLSNYMTDEKMKVEYVSLSLDEIAKDITVTEAELKNFYTDNLNFYSTPEKVKVAHIMIGFEKGDAASIEKAKQRIKDLHERIVAGESFEALAEKYSDDVVSGKDGGTLEWVAKGELNNSLFEQAAFALNKPNQISDPVSTEDGMHIIKLLNKKPEVVESYEKVKEEVAIHLKKQKGEHILAEKADQLVTLAYEHPDSLELVAEKIGLEVKHSDFLTKAGSENAPFDSPKVIKAAFSEVVTSGQNSEMIEVEDDHYVVLRMSEHLLPEQIPLEKVQDKVKTTLIQKGSQEKAAQLAKQIQQRIEKGEKPSTLATEFNLTYKTVEGLTRVSNDAPTDIVDEAFRLPKPKDEPVASTVTLSGGSSGIVVLSKVTDGNLDVETDNRVSYLTDSISENYGIIEYSLFVQEAKKTTKVENLFDS